MTEKLKVSPYDTRRAIPHSEALDAAHRLINSHFGNDNRARASIPARPDHDDDLVLCAYIRQQATRPTDTGVVELNSSAIDRICDEAVKLADAQAGDHNALWRAAYHGAMLARASLSQAKGVGNE